MNHDTPERLFVTDACIDLPAMAHRRGCSCALHARRRLGGTLLAGGLAASLPAWAQQEPAADEGIKIRRSQFTKLVPAEQIGQAAAQQYTQMTGKAASQRALGPDNHPQVRRLRYIAQRIIPFTPKWNPRAQQWKWEVNLIGSQEVNAFCMPGGKIAFYYGILQKLQLNDAEVAQIMGHEAGHALLEHAREQMGKNTATSLAVNLGSLLLGLGAGSDALLRMGGQLLSLTYSRSDESEADLLGLELAARAGYDPGAGITLWQKMGQASKGAPPEFLSTHPAGETRIRDLQENLPKVQGLYARAERPGQDFGPPAKS